MSGRNTIIEASIRRDVKTIRRVVEQPKIIRPLSRAAVSWNISDGTLDLHIQHQLQILIERAASLGTTFFG